MCADVCAKLHECEEHQNTANSPQKKLQMNCNNGEHRLLHRRYKFFEWHKKGTDFQDPCSKPTDFQDPSCPFFWYIFWQIPADLSTLRAIWASKQELIFVDGTVWNYQKVLSMKQNKILQISQVAKIAEF